MACADVATANAKITAKNRIILSSVVTLCEAPALGGTGASRLAYRIGRVWGVRGEVPIHCCQLYASSAAAHVILPFWSKDGDGAVLHRVFDAQPDSLHMAY